MKIGNGNLDAAVSALQAERNDVAAYLAKLDGAIADLTGQRPTKDGTRPEITWKGKVSPSRLVNAMARAGLDVPALSRRTGLAEVTITNAIGGHTSMGPEAVGKVEAALTV